MIIRIFATSVVALGLGFMVEGAKAEQTFICGDGRMLQVEHQDVERLKRTDPCVAAYFGVSAQLVPLPVKRPSVASLPLKGATVSREAPQPPGAMAQVEYRNVRIINAAPGGTGWFRHTR